MNLPKFHANEQAMIYNTGDNSIDGQVVVIVGISSDLGYCVFYNVQLEHPIKDGWTVITLTNACLKNV